MIGYGTRTAAWGLWQAASLGLTLVQGVISGFLVTAGGLAGFGTAAKLFFGETLSSMSEEAATAFVDLLVGPLLGVVGIGTLIGVVGAVAWRMVARQRDGRSAAARAWRNNGEVWTWQPNPQGGTSRLSKGLRTAIAFVATPAKILGAAYLFGFLPFALFGLGFGSELISSSLTLRGFVETMYFGATWPGSASVYALTVGDPSVAGIGAITMAHEIAKIGLTAAAVGLTARAVIRGLSGKSSALRAWRKTGAKWTKQPSPA